MKTNEGILEAERRRSEDQQGKQVIQEGLATMRRQWCEAKVTEFLEERGLEASEAYVAHLVMKLEEMFLEEEEERS